MTIFFLLFLLLPWEGEGRGGGCTAGPSRSAGRTGAAGGGPRAWGGRAAVSHRGRGVAAGEGEGPCMDGKMEKRRNPRYNNGGGSPEKTTLAGAEHKIVDWR
jgi:hypothetical protein